MPRSPLRLPLLGLLYPHTDYYVIMGTRIVVLCYSQAIPGMPDQRSATMANIICQNTWRRDFDKSQDRIRSTGPCVYDDNRCIFVVDNGPLNSQEISVSMYTWDGGKL